MGAARPRAVDVTRRLTAAIAVAATMLVGLVVWSGAATAKESPQAGGANGRAFASVPPPASLTTSRDYAVVSPASPRGQSDADTGGWAEPAAVGVLLARPVAFFVGLTDTSDPAATSVPVARVRERSPPSTGASVPR